MNKRDQLELVDKKKGKHYYWSPKEEVKLRLNGGFELLDQANILTEDGHYLFLMCI